MNDCSNRTIFDEDWVQSLAAPVRAGLKNTKPYRVPAFEPLKNRRSDLASQRSQPEPLNQPAVNSAVSSPEYKEKKPSRKKRSFLRSDIQRDHCATFLNSLKVQTRSLRTRQDQAKERALELKRSQWQERNAPGVLYHPPTVYPAGAVRQRYNRNGVLLSAEGLQAKRTCGHVLAERTRPIAKAPPLFSRDGITTVIALPRNVSLQNSLFLNFYLSSPALRGERLPQRYGSLLQLLRLPIRLLPRLRSKTRSSGLSGTVQGRRLPLPDPRSLS